MTYLRTENLILRSLEFLTNLYLFLSDQPSHSFSSVNVYVSWDSRRLYVLDYSWTHISLWRLSLFLVRFWELPCGVSRVRVCVGGCVSVCECVMSVSPFRTECPVLQLSSLLETESWPLFQWDLFYDESRVDTFTFSFVFWVWQKDLSFHWNDLSCYFLSLSLTWRFLKSWVVLFTCYGSRTVIKDVPLVFYIRYSLSLHLVRVYRYFNVCTIWNIRSYTFFKNIEIR